MPFGEIIPRKGAGSSSTFSKQVRCAIYILKDILSTLQGIRNSIAEISGKLEAHSLNSYNEQLELRREVRSTKDHLLHDLNGVNDELDEQTVLLKKLTDDVSDYN